LEITVIDLLWIKGKNVNLFNDLPYLSLQLEEGKLKLVHRGQEA